MLKLLGRYDESIAMLKDMLRELPDLTSAQKQAVQRELDELAGEVGSVTVTTDERGATVELDGEARGTLPLDAPLIVNPGQHRITLKRADGATAEALVRVAARQRVVVGQVDWSPPPEPERPKPKAVAAPAPPPTPPSKPKPAEERRSHVTLAAALALLGRVLPSTDETYVSTGPGLLGGLSFSFHAGGARVGAYYGHALLTVPLCSASGFSVSQTVTCNASLDEGGVQFGGMLNPDPLGLELELRAGYQVVKVTRDYSARTDYESSNAEIVLGGVLIPRYHPRGPFAVGALLGLDTSGFGQVGAYGALDF